MTPPHCCDLGGFEIDLCGVTNNKEFVCREELRSGGQCALMEMRQQQHGNWDACFTGSKGGRQVSQSQQQEAPVTEQWSRGGRCTWYLNIDIAFSYRSTHSSIITTPSGQGIDWGLPHGGVPVETPLGLHSLPTPYSLPNNDIVELLFGIGFRKLVFWDRALLRSSGWFWTYAP